MRNKEEVTYCLNALKNTLSHPLLLGKTRAKIQSSVYTLEWVLSEERFDSFVRKMNK